MCGVLTLGCQTIEHIAVSRGGAQSVLCPAGWLLPPIEVVKRTPTHSPFGCKPSSTTTKNDKFLFRTNTSLRKENNYWISYSIFMIVVYLKKNLMRHEEITFLLKFTVITGPFLKILFWAFNSLERRNSPLNFWWESK